VTDPLVFPAALAAALLVALPFVQASSTPSAEERALVGFVDAQLPAALALLERVVNINSGTQNLPGVREVGRVFSAELESLGFRTRWVDGAAFHRAGHLVADHPGTGPRILLIGHLDTVFEKDSPFQKFERVDERSARGPGIIDMKGGDVVMISALKALHAAGALGSMNLVVVMTGDEEDSGRPLSLAREARRHGAARDDQLAGDRHRGPRALVADLSRGRRLRRRL
jgi:glutamate carboxypeptidase